MPTLEKIEKILNEDYWLRGTEAGVSQYQNMHVDLEWNRPILDCVEAATGTLDGKTFLDLGCGFGAVVAVALERGASAFGVDLSAYAVREAQKQHPPLAGRLLRGSMHELPWPAESFDVVYSNQAFEHLPGEYCGEMAKEIFRVCKPGAAVWVGLVLDETGEYQPEGINPNDHDATHVNLRERPWWDDRFLSAGFELAPEIDAAFRAAKSYENYQKYNWHTLSFRKPDKQTDDKI